MTRVTYAPSFLSIPSFPPTTIIPSPAAIHDNKITHALQKKTELNYTNYKSLVTKLLHLKKKSYKTTPLQNKSWKIIQLQKPNNKNVDLEYPI